MKLKFVLKGGPGSGFHGHEGRPGKVGGSSSNVVGSVTLDTHDVPILGIQKNDDIDSDIFDTSFKDVRGMLSAVPLYYLPDKGWLISTSAADEHGDLDTYIRDTTNINVSTQDFAAASCRGYLDVSVGSVYIYDTAMDFRDLPYMTNSKQLVNKAEKTQRNMQANAFKLNGEVVDIHILQETSPIFHELSGW